MRLPRIQIGLGTMLVLMLIISLIAALVAQEMRTDHRIAELQAEARYLRSLTPDGYLTAYAGLDQSKVQAVGDRILVVAATHVMNHRPDAQYVWAVRMFDPRGKQTLFTKLYDKRLVRPPRGQRVHPTLADIIQPPLPAGNYRVEVTLHEVPPNTDIASLHDEEIARGTSVVSMSGEVSLGPSEGTTPQVGARSAHPTPGAKRVP